ncbi:unnamed protein product [Periconia digitata]|uniref:DNA 3'-5' helicase n=1 Tax=Periconia digitata TaxID=1303443 RepID=A0A9W4UH75_9PLEO|nr:unnamed protein product [Periconia digitata]
MRERICGFVGADIASKLILGTFHSVARRFLFRYGHLIGLPKNFGIADANESLSILKRIIKREDYGVEPKQARSRISGLKSKGISVEQFAAQQKKVDQHEFARLYSEYQEYLKAQSLLDFDDMLVRTVDLLREHPACVSSIQAVLIDEYQDTNNIQYELMKLMAQRQGRITIVGDKDQSIYGFRSAEIKNFELMRKQLPAAIVVDLEINYRSSGCIIQAAKAVIEQDDSRSNKPLVANHCAGALPTLRHMATASLEAKWIVEEIIRTKTLAAGLLNHSDYSILIRSATLSLSIERALGNAGIPYRMVGGKRFFDRAEIKIILDYLRVINQPHLNDALVRIINLPSRKIGETTIKSLLEEADKTKTSLWQLILDFSQGKKKPDCKISSQAQNGIDTFVNVIITSRRKLFANEDEECSVAGLISHVLQKISFEAYLKNLYKDSHEERWANVQELVTQATQLASTLLNSEEDALPVVDGVEQRADTAADVLSKFLANVALSTEVEKEEGREASQVTISTIHAAKGLEWPVTFIPAVYDGTIPHSRAEDHNEERRLLFVGMTRAQALLYLSCPIRQGNQEDTVLSRFVSDPKIQKYFSLNGPTIGCPTNGCSVLKDIATILSRECPQAASIQAARNTLEFPEDVRYPLTREAIDGEEPSWNEPKINDDQYEQYSKRRKTDHSSLFTKKTVTMQQSANFSMAKTTIKGTNSGFTSAKDLGDIQRMQEEAEAIRTLVAAQDATAGKAVYKETKTFAKKPVQPKKAKARTPGQGSITSFFSRAKTPVSTEAEELPSKTSLLKRSSSSFTGSPPLADISNLQPQPLPASRSYEAPVLPNYKVQNARMTTKPKRTEAESLRYTLYSSSPPKPEGPPKYHNSSTHANEPESPTKQASFSSASATFSQSGSTFHTTSMELLQSRAGGPLTQRRTLGARRTMQGWSVKNHAPPRPRQQ